jgi:hypothetical protein
VDSNNTGQYVAAATTSRLYVSINGGGVWSFRDYWYGQLVSFYGVVNIDRTDTPNLYVFVLLYNATEGETQVWRISSYGMGTPVKMGLVFPYDVEYGGIRCSQFGDTVMVSTGDGKVYISTDYGLTWTEQTSLKQLPITDIDMADYGGTMMVSMRDLSPVQTGVLYITEDFGQTWQETGFGVGKTDYLNCAIGGAGLDVDNKVYASADSSKVYSAERLPVVVDENPIPGITSDSWRGTAIDGSGCVMWVGASEDAPPGNGIAKRIVGGYPNSMGWTPSAIISGASAAAMSDDGLTVIVVLSSASPASTLNFTDIEYRPGTVDRAIACTTDSKPFAIFDITSGGGTFTPVGGASPSPLGVCISGDSSAGKWR